jgi:hypothetical protein
MTQEKFNRNPELQDAIEAVRRDEPDPQQFRAAVERVHQRVQTARENHAVAIEQIRGCEDIQKMLPAYTAGTLPAARALLVKAHLHECAGCRRGARVDEKLAWSMPEPAPRPLLRWPAFALAAVLVIGFAALLVRQMYFAAPAGPRATVQSLEGAVYGVSTGGERPLAVGAQLVDGELIHTASGAHAFLRLTDGSVVEMNQQTAVAVQARGKDTTLALDQGAVIVQAAKLKAGHLYVRTPDCRVAVTGTVFSVNSGLKGSRVSVIEGEVHVAHAGVENVLHAGDQVATSPRLTRVDMHEEIGWSSQADKHLELLAQFANLRREIDKIPTPGPRYSSNLIGRIPTGSVLYAAVPNAGDALAEANRIFQQQLQQSDALREWFSRGNGANPEEFTQAIEKVRLLGQYLGDEVVLVGVNLREEPGMVVLAELRRSGIREFLETEFPATGSKPALVRAVDEHELLMATPAMVKKQVVALVRDDVVAFSNNLDALRTVDAQLNAGPSGFVNTDFGRRIAEAYSRGAGFMIAANIRQMMIDSEGRARRSNRSRREDPSLERSGFRDLQYLIAEHREVNGVPDNHLTVDFAGQRRGIPSWLAAPAPMGSLEFVSPNAALVFAFVAKSPAQMMNDVMQIATASPRTHPQASETEAKFKVRLQEMAGYFGGDAVVALDGPVLPTPAWKLVVQVYDPERLQASLQQLVQDINSEARGHGKPGVELVREDSDGQPMYVIRSVEPRPLGGEVHYTFAAGYMAVAGSRAVLINTLRTRTNRDSLARSADFRALLPRDQNANYSAVAYQNLSPVVQPLLSQLSDERARLVQELAADARPSVICAYGEQTRIDLVSNSKLFGFDFLALTGLLHEMGTSHSPAP